MDSDRSLFTNNDDSTSQATKLQQLERVDSILKWVSDPNDSFFQNSSNFANDSDFADV